MKIAAKIGNLNDKHSVHDRSAEATTRWKIIDKIVSWFYIRGF